MSAESVDHPPVFKTDRPLIFAHRGGARLAPENTLAAIDNGIKLGSDGLEIDVQLSSDGIPVVIHDPTLDRTTNRTGPVRHFTAAELARVDAGFHFEVDSRFPFRGQGIGIPRLDEVLKRHPGARVIIEMKGGEPALARAVADAVITAGAVDRVCVSSFQQTSIDTIRAEHPAITTSASVREARWTLHRSWVRWPWVSEQPYFAFQVPEHTRRLRVVSPAFVRQVHKQGQVVQVWVVNERSDIHRWLDWGIDGIISDRPDIAISARDDWFTRRSASGGGAGPRP
jgi:glycerophosphoryl diester phosphodiesterase